MRLFLDTNVLIDYFGQREPFCRDWDAIEALQITGFAELWVCAQSFSDAFYVLRGAVGAHRLQEAFSAALEFVNVCPATHEDVLEAARRSWDDFEDCLINVCAERVDSDYFLTRDKSGFRLSSLNVCAPCDLLNCIERDHGIVFEMVDFPAE